MTKVLVFESDHAFAMELRTRLTALGCTVQVFSEGTRDMLSALSIDPLPGLILLSVELRGVNGFSICNKLKKHPQLSSVPLLLLSSHSSPETFAQHQRLPTRAQIYLHKPIGFDELHAHIRGLLPLGPTPAAVEPELTELDDIELIEDSIIEEPDMATMQQSTDPARTAMAPEDKTGMTRQAQMMPIGEQSSEPAHDSAPQPEFLQYGLGEEDDDEDTIVASGKALLEEADAKLKAQAADAPSSDSRRPSATISSLPASGSGSWPLEQDPSPSARAGEITGLRQALARASQQAEHAELELAQLRPLAAETEPLRAQLSAVKQQLTTANNTIAGYQQQNSELRDAVSQRDHDLLQLRERLSGKEREVNEARSSALKTEQGSSDLKTSLEALEQERNELQAQVFALQADKQLADKRSADFKQGAKKIAEQLNLRSRELRDARQAHEEALAQANKGKQEIERQLEAKWRQEMSQVEARSQQEQAALKEQHEAALGTLKQQHDEAIDTLKLQHDEAISALEMQHGEEAAGLKRQNDEALAELRTSADAARETGMAERESAWQNERQALQASFDEQRQEQQLRVEALTAELSKSTEGYKLLQEELVETKSSLTAAHERALAEQQKIETLKVEHGEQLARREQALSEQHDQALQALRQEQQSAINSAIEQAQQQAEARVSEIQQQLGMMDLQLQQTTEQLEKARARITEIQSSAKSNHAALQNARAALSSVVEQLASHPPPPPDEEEL